ncbi:MAG: PQQ-dependent sugar dehydrogenase [Verrucomicrobiaceae bacterium]|nr:PQQ-dependent sugar dehydrogenase [Verrucomicrobiaceae bacterium]
MLRLTQPIPLLATLFLAAVINPVSAAFPALYLKPVVQQQFHAPTNIIDAPDSSHRLFVTDQPGQIYIIEGGMMRPQPFLDISSKCVPLSTGYDERGLLGMAFHPGYDNPVSPGYRKFYLYYSAPTATPTNNPTTPQNHVSVLAEYQVSPTDPNTADIGSERILLTFGEPQSNHNGGQLQFGPDGMLYFSTGDGGSSNDNNSGHTGVTTGRPTDNLGNAQDRTKYLGKICRIDPIDPDGAGPLTYTIPADNPSSPIPPLASKRKSMPLGCATLGDSASTCAPEARTACSAEMSARCVWKRSTLLSLEATTGGATWRELRCQVFPRAR